jgi:hypothetical protein
MFDRDLLWRATDFWREGLKPEWRGRIARYNTWKRGERALEKGSLEYESIANAESKQMLPADFFMDVAGWWWFVKEDGYLVSLSRGKDGKWSMHTRGGTKLTPPPGFLEGLQLSMQHPPVMVGELVTSFTGCETSDRADAGQRTVLRNEHFAIIHRVLERGDDPRAWVGLRVKVFAFPTSRQSVRRTYETSKEVMAKTLHDHPHIGMCRAGELQSTQHAIDIFERVVQLGLEGIVIVNPDVPYGTKHTENRHDDRFGTCFKMKQKVVLPYRPFRNTGRSKDVWKDGTKQSEHQFTTEVHGNEVGFTDQQGRETGRSRLKYMEYAAGAGDTFPCQSDYRHMHFATHEDMSVMVPAKKVQAKNFPIQNILGWDASVDRIRSWDIDEDRHALQQGSNYVRLHNPRPFALHAVPKPQDAVIVIEDDEPIVIDDDEAAAAPAPEEKRRKVSLADWGRRSFASDYDGRKGHGGRGSSAGDVGSLLKKLAACM